MRVPLYKPNKMQAARIEYRGLDSASNPYLAYAVILAAGLKGIEHEYELMPAVTEDLAAMTPQNAALWVTTRCLLLCVRLLTVPRIPSSWQRLWGEQVFEQFLRNKRADWEQYQAQVTPYELKHNLGIL